MLLSDGDNLGDEEAFKDTINTKVGDALETKRKEVDKLICKNTSKSRGRYRR